MLINRYPDLSDVENVLTSSHFSLQLSVATTSPSRFSSSLLPIRNNKHLTLIMKLKGTREASHADSWYDGDPDSLSGQLDEFLSRVPDSIDGSGLPIPGAKVVIAP